MKTNFVGDRIQFSLTNQRLLKILYTLCHSEVFSCSTISHSFVPKFKSLRRIFALSSFFFVLDRFAILSLCHLVGKQLDIIFDIFLFEVTLTFISLAVCLADFFGILLTLSWTALIIFFDRAVAVFFSEEVFSCNKLFISFYNMVNCGFGHLQELNYLEFCPSRAMKLNYCLSFAHFK